MKVVVAGGTGLVGRALVASLLADGHAASVLTRGRSAEGAARHVHWDPGAGGGDWESGLRGADAVVNLAGATIGSWPWTAAKEHAMVRSRLDATGAIVAALGRLPAGERPGVLVSASGIDYYGHRADDRPVGEDAPPGEEFLAGLSTRWEAAALEAEPLGVRVVLVRTALVVARGAPALEMLALPFRLFVGGPLGRGDQWFSWIHLDDLVGIYRLALANPEARGPLNAAAPEALRQRDAARVLGQVLGRPSFFPTPAPLLRLVLGEMADLLLHGRRVDPARARGLGYAFRRPELRGALEEALKGG